MRVYIIESKFSEPVENFQARINDAIEDFLGMGMEINEISFTETSQNEMNKKTCYILCSVKVQETEEFELNSQNSS